METEIVHVVSLQSLCLRVLLFDIREQLSTEWIRVHVVPGTTHNLAHGVNEVALLSIFVGSMTVAICPLFMGLIDDT